MLKSLIIFLISFLTIHCKLEETNGYLNLNLSFSFMDGDSVGKKGTTIAVFYQREPLQLFINTKKDEVFTAYITNGRERYKVGCGIWKDYETSHQITVFCNIGENINAGNYNILFNETKPFKFRDYLVVLDVNRGEKHLKFKKVDKDLIDLYADNQKLVIEDKVDSYELKFNIVSYNQELLFFNNLILDNCKTENNALKCYITKKDLLTHFNPQCFSGEIYWFDPINYENDNLHFIPEIETEAKNIAKKDIYVQIKNLLVNTSESETVFAYETNVTEISNFLFF